MANLVAVGLSGYSLRGLVPQFPQGYGTSLIVYYKKNFLATKLCN